MTAAQEMPLTLAAISAPKAVQSATTRSAPPNRGATCRAHASPAPIILRGKQAGLSLDQIQQMIATTDPASRAGILRAQRDQLRRRIAATQAALEIIDSVLSCRHADFTRCPRFRAVITDRAGGQVVER